MTSAAAGSLTILRFIDLEGTAVKVRAVQRLHGAGRIGIRHLHETETTRASRVTVSDQGDALDGSMLREQGANRIIGRGEREISNV
jgi:hypothetical protein